MKNIWLFPVCFIVFLSACSSDDSESDNVTGADRDEHGCIVSAGYSWCESTNQCERPWELAEREGFDNTEEEYAEYCKG